LNFWKNSVRFFSNIFSNFSIYFTTFCNFLAFCVF
jgi:hypothetical protein